MKAAIKRWMSMCRYLSSGSSITSTVSSSSSPVTSSNVVTLPNNAAPAQG